MASRKALPIRITGITKDNYNMLRKLNQVVFPVVYSEQFYQNIHKPDVQPITKMGSQLLRQILEYAESHSDIADVYLHVQTSNQEALDFYKKQGFEITGKIDNYYKKIDPPDCYIVSKKFVHVAMAGSKATLD